MEAVLTIAGSDSSGGAGIQADLKTIAALGCFGESAICALTAQNTLGVSAIFDVDPEFIVAQIDAVFEDIRPAAVKIGMISHGAAATAIAAALARHEATHIVVDPVMVATSGSSLAADDVVAALKRELFPLAEVITPNRAEAEVLAGMTIDDESAMVAAADAIAAECASVPTILIKGGHGVGAPDESSDFARLPDGEGIWLRGPRYDNPNTHGTSCTLSSANACELALGYEIVEALARAKAYVAGAIAAGLDLGHGSGPLDHFYALRESSADSQSR